MRHAHKASGSRATSIKTEDDAGWCVRRRCRYKCEIRLRGRNMI